jgi:hypothetical protein
MDIRPFLRCAMLLRSTIVDESRSDTRLQIGGLVGWGDNLTGIGHDPRCGDREGTVRYDKYVRMDKVAQNP